MYYRKFSCKLKNFRTGNDDYFDDIYFRGNCHFVRNTNIGVLPENGDKLSDYDYHCD